MQTHFINLTLICEKIATVIQAIQQKLDYQSLINFFFNSQHNKNCKSKY